MSKAVAVPPDVEVSIQSFCADEWPTDFEMQDYCYESQVEAYEKSKSYDLSDGSRESSIISAKCSRDWTDAKGRVDWEMHNYCVESQQEALEKIHRRRK